MYFQLHSNTLAVDSNSNLFHHDEWQMLFPGYGWNGGLWGGKIMLGKFWSISSWWKYFSKFFIHYKLLLRDHQHKPFHPWYIQERSLHIYHGNELEFESTANDLVELEVSQWFDPILYGKNKKGRYFIPVALVYYSIYWFRSCIL